MAKSLRSFLEDCRTEIPNEIVHIQKEVDPAHYDVTAIIKHLDELKKFPILIFDRPLNLHGRVNDFKLVMNCEISQGKIQVALGLPRGTSRERMTEVCLEREEHKIPPRIVDKSEAPVKEVVKGSSQVTISYTLPLPTAEVSADTQAVLDFALFGGAYETSPHSTGSLCSSRLFGPPVLSPW
ncbi:MAG: UbiD family decarboxylase [Deltaproteobacteria bacterium]|nr:UbiD family decarboxylase [Deltaproteobacteria bacterium]